MKQLLVLLSILFLFQACNSGGGNQFEALEDTTVSNPVNDPEIDGPVTISSVAPTDDPYYVTAGLHTFAVQIDGGSGDNIVYDFRLDGVSVQNSTSAFYVLNGTGMTVGAHTLEVIAENTTYSDTYTFNLYVNTPPTLTLLSNTGTTVSCIGGTFSMNVSSSDVDGDSMAFSFYFNGSLGSASLSNSSGASTASTTFTPSCLMVGNNNVKIRVTDSNGEYDEETVAVTVSNPSVASITGYSPITTPVVIESTGTQQFIISPDGTPPYTIDWTMTPGGAVGACANQTTCTLNGGGAFIGSYSLLVELEDSNSSSDSQPFNIIFNAKHTFTTTPTSTPTVDGVVGSASTVTSLRFNCNDSIQFSMSSNDQNFGDAGQTHSIAWTYGGVDVTHPSIAHMFSASSSVGSNPITSTLTFDPSCDSLALQGEKEIKVVVSDGYEETEHAWDVFTNYLSTYCLNLDAGEICTIAGRPGQGSGSSVISDSSKIRIYPGRLIQGPAEGTYFISDTNNGFVWFYNGHSSDSYSFKSCSSSTCSAVTGPFTTTTVSPNRLVALVGTGAPGLGTVGQIASNFYLNTPAGLAWDNTNMVLYISDSTNNRILSVNFNTGSTANTLGRPQIFGGQCTPIGSCTNTTAVTAASLHKCTTPTDLVLNGASLYAACYANPAAEYTLKVFDTVGATGQNLIKAHATTFVEGTMNGTAQSTPIYGLIKHPTEDALVATTLAGACNLLAINISGAPSFYGAAVGGAVAPAANSMMRLTRNTSACTTANNSRWDTLTTTFRGYSIYPRVRAGSLQGFYLVDTPAHNVAFINTTNATTVTIGGLAVSPGFVRRIWGSGVGGSARPVSGANAANIFNSPLGAIETSTHLIIGDRTNYLFAKLDTYVNDGATTNLFSGTTPGGFDGDGDVVPTSTRLNEPTSLNYSPTENRLYISDTLNYRIRYMDLDVGTVKTEISNGASVSAGDAADNALPNANAFRTPRDIFFVENKNTLLYASSSNNSLNVRAYNKNSSGTDVLFNTSVNAGRVTTVAGRNGIVAANWINGSMGGQLATSAAVSLHNIWGVLADTDGNTLRMSNNANHCILKVNSVGIITMEMGTCTSSYAAAGPIQDGAVASALFRNPRDMELDLDYSTYGNFFIADGESLTTSISGVRYVNLHPTDTVTIKDTTASDVDIAPGEIKTIVSGIGMYITGVATFDNWICYSQGLGATVFSTTPQNVICFDRSGVLPVKTIGKGTSATVKGGVQLALEQEGIDASSATLVEPSGLAFDADGNLYIAEKRNHTIRMVKRWW